ncbi:MAG: ORF6N domain-containing protein [Bacteroidales bacterium]|nr:ORF6N domain-containing protein [Bacteroidales bacterium]
MFATIMNYKTFTAMTNILEVENKIITLRGQQVILSNHVAELYGVETREVNQAIKNNPEKFPDGYILELDKKEKEEVIKIFDNLGNLLYSPANPKAFTEKGLYMLATILKSDKAVETTIAIVEAYAKLKELSRVMTEIPQHEENSLEQKTLLQRGGQLVEDLLTDVLPVQSSETSFELNLAMFKFKHSVKRENDEEMRKLREKVAALKQKFRQQ